MVKSCGQVNRELRRSKRQGKPTGPPRASKGNRWAFRQVYLALRAQGIQHDKAVALTLKTLTHKSNKAFDK